MNDYQKLLSPIKIGKVIFRNRIFSAPMVPFALLDSMPRPTDAFVEHFVAKARGGAACVSFSGVSFFPGGPIFDIYKYEHMRSLASMVDKIHACGSKVAAEDIPGVMVRPDYSYSVSGEQIVGLGYDPDAMTVHPKGEMPEEIMDRIADDYADVASRLCELGIDVLQLHFLNDPIGQFLSPAYNKRTDQYGGSVENRVRFPMMVIDRVRKRTGNNLLLWLRMAGSEKMPGGIKIEDTIEAVKILQDKIDIAEVVGLGPKQTVPWELVELTGMPSDFMPPMSNVHLARAVKQSGVKIPVMTTGGLQDPDEVEGILERGEADLIGIARGLIADPDLPNKLYAGRPEDIIPCVKCYKCVDSPLRFGCTVNPLQGWQHYKKIEPAVIPRKVAVIGGGPAGMEAATIAAKRGHRVTLFERSDHLGGQLSFADKMPFKRGMLKFKQYLIRQLEQSGVDVRLNTTATKEMLAADSFEHVVLAVGARPKQLNVEGDMQRVLYPTGLFEKEDQVRGKVVVIGGGVTGCEIALYLAQQGHETTIVEYTNKLCTGAHVEYTRALLVPLMQEKRITVLTDTKVVRITEKEVVVERDGKQERITADTVIQAVGMEGRTDEALALWQNGIPTSIIGDCAAATDVYKAMHSAFDAAIRL
jgi:2,4-dienoyl-CoA reductase-like NADH-dependent reductase (Old Yellow Enzyme family)/thioredoxin reductase